MHRTQRLLTATMAAGFVALAVLAVWVPALEAQGTAHAMYTRALARERELRHAANKPTLAEIRGVVASYENVVRRHPRSGYSDNALWQGGNLALLAFERFGQAADRRTALRLLNQLKSEYPSSSLVARVPEVVARGAARGDGRAPVRRSHASGAAASAARQSTSRPRRRFTGSAVPRRGCSGHPAGEGAGTGALTCRHGRTRFGQRTTGRRRAAGSRGSRSSTTGRSVGAGGNRERG